MNNPIEIREAARGDLDQLSGLFDRYRRFYRQPSDPEGARRFLTDRMLNRDSVIYIAVHEIRLAGFVQCYPIFTSVGMKRSWLLNDLFVLEEFRKRGVAKMLIEKCKALAVSTGANGLMLETEKSNAVGNQLYPAVGFERMDASNFYFWKNNS